MTVEEQQLRAWARSVFRHRALQWLDRQRRCELVMPVSNPKEELDLRQRDWTIGFESTQEMSLWLVSCRQQLNVRERKIVDALFQGWTAAEIAEMLQCNVSTVRRSIYRIRVKCPRWDN